jgi:TP901 family phage tail tape measure protein
MAIGMPPIKVAIMAVDKFSTTYGRMTNKVNSSAKNLSNKGRAMTMGFTLPMAMMTGAMFKTALDFNKFMNMVEAKSTKRGKSIDELRMKAKELGGTTVHSARAVAQGMGYLAQAGFNTGEIFAAIEPTLKLATATSSGLGETADWVSNIMKAYGKEAGETGEIAGVLAMVTAKTNVNLAQVAKTFAMAAPVAKMYGLSLRDTALFTGLLGNAGIQGTRGATVLKNMMLRLAAPTKKASGYLKDFGVEVADMGGNMRHPGEILKDFFSASKGKTQQETLAALKNIFGMRAIAGATVLSRALTEGKEATHELSKMLMGAGVDSLNAMDKIMRSNGVGTTMDFVSAIEALSLELMGAGGMFAGITGALHVFTKGIRSFNASSPMFMKTVGTLIPLLMAMPLAAWAIGTLTSSIMGLGTAFMVLKGASESAYILGLFAKDAAFASTAASVSGIAGGFTSILASALGLVVPLAAAAVSVKTLADVVEGGMNLEHNAKAAGMYLRDEELMRKRVQENPEIFKKYFAETRAGSVARETSKAAKSVFDVRGSTGYNLFSNPRAMGILRSATSALPGAAEMTEGEAADLRSMNTGQWARTEGTQQYTRVGREEEFAKMRALGLPMGNANSMLDLTGLNINIIVDPNSGTVKQAFVDNSGGKNLATSGN